MTAPWAKSHAKDILIEDIRSGKVTLNTPTRKVYNMHQVYSEYEFKIFSRNMRNIRRALLEELPDEKWRKSNAKKMLGQDILKGVVTETTDPLVVYNMHEEYKTYPFRNFKPNLERLLESFTVFQRRVESDAIALTHDKQLCQPTAAISRGNPRWHHGSRAEALLKTDVDTRNHVDVKPSDLQMTRDEYREFPKAVFSKHVHQEVVGCLEKAYWSAKKAAKSK